MKKGLVGGQAVADGVLLFYHGVYALAVRTSKGIKTRTGSSWLLRTRLLRIPFIRGIISLLAAIVVGLSATYQATTLSEEENEQEETLSPLTILITAVISISLVFVFIKVIPLFVTTLTISSSYPVLFNVVDGLLRIAVLVGYVLLVSRLEEIQTLFSYHGAEHKVIHAYERDSVSLADAKKQSIYLTRCSTSFVLFVLLVAIIVYSLFPISANFTTLLVMRVALLIPIASISYEIIRIAHVTNWWVFQAIISPGMYLQRLTVKEPSDDQLEVAIACLRAAQKAAS